MPRITLLAMTAFISSGSAALADIATQVGVANRSATSNAQRVDLLLQGKGQPGDIVRSVSNPDVVFKVMPNGTIERKNERYGTVEYRRAISPFRDYNYRGR